MKNKHMNAENNHIGKKAVMNKLLFVAVINLNIYNKTSNQKYGICKKMYLLYY